MKLYTQKSYQRMIALVLVIIIFSSIPIAVSAEQNTPNMGDTENGAKNTVSLGEGSYSYTPLGDGTFLIEDTEGTLSIVNDNVVLQFGNGTVTMPAFDYYKVVDKNGNLRFYQADVAKNPMQATNFVYIAIYAENPSYTIHIHYENIIENKLYNMAIPLTQIQFLYFDQLSMEFNMGTDEVSQRLKSSARVYMQGVYEERSGAGDISVNAIIPADLVDDGNTTIDFDEYTNSDGIIHSYEDVYMWDYYVDDRTITDDPIVQIIPKDLFFMLGTHIHVGKEYGFFVRVTTDPISTTGYAADVMVFDITHFEPAFATDSPGGARVAPLFQYRYRVTDEPGQEMAVGLSQVVIPHLHYDAAEYFLKGVTFKFTLENPTALNPGDNGYNPYEDDGAFIIQTRANMSGVKQKSKGASFVLDTVEYALGFSRFAGPILSTYAYVNGLYKGFAEGEYFYHCDPVEANHESLISTDYTNSTDQIWNYGNLIKSATVTFKSEPESKYLVNVGGGYAEGLYVIARKSGSQYDLRRIVTSVAVRIVEDNTYAVSNYEFGEIIEHGCATGTYEVGRYKRLSDVTSYEDRFVIIPKGLEEYIMKITVPISGNYRIRTVSLTNNNGDPNFYMINATQGVAVGTVIDDIDYPYNNNATLTTSLTAGDVYYLVAYRYGLSDEYALQIELIS